MYEFAEILFTLTNGTPLIDTFWIILWIVVGCCLMILPLWIHDLYTKNIHFILLGGIVWFFFFFIIVVGVPIMQVEMLSECKTFSEVIKEQSIVLTECRHKANYFDNTWSEWKIK